MSSGLDQLGVWAAAIVAISGALALAWRGIRWLLRLVRRVVELLDDWQGVPARPGVPERLGVLGRLDRIEHELYPNSGASLRDVINRIAAATVPENTP